MDEGVLVERLKNPSIWELPDELGEFIYPRQAAEIIILGLKPKGSTEASARSEPVVVKDL